MSKQTSTGGLIRKKGGLKRTPKQLTKIIELVNLLPPEFNIPVTATVKLWNPPMPDMKFEGYQIRFKGPEAPSLDHLPEKLRTYFLKGPSGFPANYHDVLFHQAEVLEWRENLLRIARREPYILSTVAGFIDWHTDTSIKYRRNQFDAAIDGVDLRYIRQCKVCGRLCFVGRLFYRGKEIEPSCSRECAHKLRNRRWKTNYNKGKYRKKDLRKPPQYLDAVMRSLKLWKLWKRSPENVQKLAKQSDVSVKQVERVLDYVEQESKKPKVG